MVFSSRVRWITKISILVARRDRAPKSKQRKIRARNTISRSEAAATVLNGPEVPWRTVLTLAFSITSVRNQREDNNKLLIMFKLITVN